MNGRAIADSERFARRLRRGWGLRPSLCGGEFDFHLLRSRIGEVLEAAGDASKPDQTRRISEIPIEKRQVAPGGVIGEITHLRVDPCRCACSAEPAGQIGDLLRRGVILQAQFERQLGDEITQPGSGCIALHRGRRPARPTDSAGLARMA